MTFNIGYIDHLNQVNQMYSNIGTHFANIWHYINAKQKIQKKKSRFHAAGMCFFVFVQHYFFFWCYLLVCAKLIQYKSDIINIWSRTWAEFFFVFVRQIGRLPIQLTQLQKKKTSTCNSCMLKKKFRKIWEPMHNQ